MRDPGNGKIKATKFDDVIDDHILTLIDTPLRRDAFNVDVISEKIKD